MQSGQNKELQRILLNYKDDRLLVKLTGQLP